MKNFEVSTTLPQEAKTLIKYRNSTFKDFDLILSQFNDVHFRIVKAVGKRPIEPHWQNKNNYPVNREVIRKILQSGYNYGFTCPTGFACFIDADTATIQEALDSFAITFRYASGTPGHFQYVYFLEDKQMGCVPLVDGAYIKGAKGFTVGPGSVHPVTKRLYGLEIRDVPIAVVKYDALMEVLKPFLKSTGSSGKSYSLPLKSASSEIVKHASDEISDIWAKAEHRRHDLTLALIGYLEKQGWTEDNIKSLISILVEKTGKGREHVAQVHYSYGKTGKEGKTKGLPTIIEIEGELNGH